MTDGIPTYKAYKIFFPFFIMLRSLRSDFLEVIHYDFLAIINLNDNMMWLNTLV